MIVFRRSVTLVYFPCRRMVDYFIVSKLFYYMKYDLMIIHISISDSPYHGCKEVCGMYKHIQPLVTT